MEHKWDTFKDELTDKSFPRIKFQLKGKQSILIIITGLLIITSYLFTGHIILAVVFLYPLKKYTGIRNYKVKVEMKEEGFKFKFQNIKIQGEWENYSLILLPNLNEITQLGFYNHNNPTSEIVKINIYDFQNQLIDPESFLMIVYRIISNFFNKKSLYAYLGKRDFHADPGPTVKIVDEHEIRTYFYSKDEIYQHYFNQQLRYEEIEKIRPSRHNILRLIGSVLIASLLLLLFEFNQTNQFIIFTGMRWVLFSLQILFIYMLIPSKVVLSFTIDTLVHSFDFTQNRKNKNYTVDGDIKDLVIKDKVKRNITKLKIYYKKRFLLELKLSNSHPLVLYFNDKD